MGRKKHIELYENYWPKASEYIFELLINNIDENSRIFEVGFSSGHILYALLKNGYIVEGCEIRKEEFDLTESRLKKYGFENCLLLENVMNIKTTYDVVFTTGLIQCFWGKERQDFIIKLASLAPKVVIISPEILCDRNTGSKMDRGVSGCAEYDTSLLVWELSHVFSKVRVGKWERDLLELKDDFVYYICEK